MKMLSHSALRTRLRAIIKKQFSQKKSAPSECFCVGNEYKHQDIFSGASVYVDESEGKRCEKSKIMRAYAQHKSLFCSLWGSKRDAPRHCFFACFDE